MSGHLFLGNFEFSVIRGTEIAFRTLQIIRSGINAVDKGQTEAARALGLTSRTTMMKVVMPQAVKNILPALGNEFITVIKETSLASTFFVGELMTTYSVVKGVTFNVIPTLMDIGVIYFVLTFTLSKLLGMAERRMRQMTRTKRVMRLCVIDS